MWLLGPSRPDVLWIWWACPSENYCLREYKRQVNKKFKEIWSVMYGLDKNEQRQDWDTDMLYTTKVMLMYICLCPNLVSVQIPIVHFKVFIYLWYCNICDKHATQDSTRQTAFLFTMHKTTYILRGWRLWSFMFLCVHLCSFGHLCIFVSIMWFV